MASRDPSRPPPLTPAETPASEGGEPSDLVARALEGDRTAWNALIARYNARVVAFLVARGTRIDRAKEITHDAWAALLERQQDGRLRELKLPVLVLKQASFLAIDEARRGRREASSAELPDPADPTPGIEDVLASRERLACARDAVERCSPAEQRVFRALYEHPELTCREVAARLGLSEQRVKQVAYEVRKRIRVALEDKS
jgi:RNA polymerase sigma factor (sigma-70 family)